MSVQASPYQLLPPLSSEEYAALRSDIQNRGVLVPVEYDEAGNVLDGHHRLQACQELGITEFPSLVRLGLSEGEKRAHVRALNLNRRHLTQAQRRELIAAELIDAPERSNRQVGEALGVDHKTVGCVRGGLVAGGEIPHLSETRGADGKTYPARRSALESAPDHQRRLAEAMLREAVPEVMAALDAGDTERAQELVGLRPATEESAAVGQPAPATTAPRPSLPPYDPMVEKVQSIALHIEKLARPPLTAAEFLRRALPYTVQQARAQAPMIRSFLDEIESGVRQ